MKRTTSRRAILAGIAASPALATLALAAIGSQSSPIDDPIFAAIVEHERSEREYRAAEGRHAVDEITDPLFDIEGDQFAELLGTTPTTRAGCVAFLRYLQAYGERWDVRPVFADYVNTITGDDLFARLADAIEAPGKAVQS